MTEFLNSIDETIGTIICFAIIIFILKLYLQWVFIKSAVEAGVKDAIKETIIDTGIAQQLADTNR